MSGLAPRAPVESVRPWRPSGRGGRPLNFTVRRTMRSTLKRLLRVIATLLLAYLLLLVTAWWSDQNSRVAALFGGHNIVLQIIVTLPLIYFLLGRVPLFREKAAQGNPQ